MKKRKLYAHNFELSATRRVLALFLTLKFVYLLAAEIQFSMMFRFPLVEACVFGNRQISSLGKILKSLPH